MPPAARAYSFLLAGLWEDVVDNVVRAIGVATYSAGNMIETQGMACSPRDIVIGTRAVTADADGTEQHTDAIVHGI